MGWLWLAWAGYTCAVCANAGPPPCPVGSDRFAPEGLEPEDTVGEWVAGYDERWDTGTPATTALCSGGDVIDGGEDVCDYVFVGCTEDWCRDGYDGYYCVRIDELVDWSGSETEDPVVWLDYPLQNEDCQIGGIEWIEVECDDGE